MTLYPLKNEFLKQLHKIKFLFSKYPQTLTPSDCKGIAQLLNGGFTFREAMEILEDKRTKYIFTRFREQLDRGNTITETVYPYLPKAYRKYFLSFVQYMVFAEGFSATIEIVEKEKKDMEKLIKNMVYPILLMLGVICGMYLFATLVLPSMLSLLTGLQVDNTSYIFMQRLIQIVSILSLWICLIITCILLFSLSKKRIVKTYQLLIKYHPNAILIQRASSQFARFFLICQSRNIATREMLQMFMHLENLPLLSYMAKEMNDSLNNGENMIDALEHAHLEHSFLRFFRIASLSSTQTEMMRGYLEMVQQRTTNQIRRFTTIIQLFSYSVIGIVIIFVYRILFIPMTILQNI